MKLQRLIEQYIAYQQSLGTAFLTDAMILRLSVAPSEPGHGSRTFVLGRWNRSWARPGP